MTASEKIRAARKRRETSVFRWSTEPRSVQKFELDRPYVFSHEEKLYVFVLHCDTSELIAHPAVVAA
jgi:hypothetical protein